MVDTITIRKWIVGALLFLPFGVMGQRYDYHLDTTVIMLGDQTKLAIENPVPMPTLEQISGEGLIALGQRVDTTTNTLYTVLTSFEPGEHWLRVGEDSVLITVQDVENVDTLSTDIKDITGILKQPYTFWEIFRWVLLALVLVGLFFLWRYVWHPYFVKKMMQSGDTATPEATIPPDERALSALENLRTKRLWQQGRSKEYHTELTDIVRRYLMDAHGINSTEMTTGQTLEFFSASRVCTDESYRLLRQMLETADMVKFAKSDPPAYEHDRSMESAVAFVKALAVKIEKADTDESIDKKEATV